MNNDIFKSIKNKYMRDSQQYENMGAMFKASQPSNSLFNGGQSIKSNSLFDDDSAVGMSKMTDISNAVLQNKQIRLGIVQ